MQATAGAGDYFGEIALIRDVPRTTTVTAVANSQLYAMERGDFVAAVTSHSGVRAAGEEVVDQRHGNAKRVGESGLSPAHYVARTDVALYSDSRG